jgi:hypothetical protein
MTCLFEGSVKGCWGQTGLITVRWREGAEGDYWKMLKELLRTFKGCQGWWHWFLWGTNFPKRQLVRTSRIKAVYKVKTTSSVDLNTKFYWNSSSSFGHETGGILTMPSFHALRATNTQNTMERFSLSLFRLFFTISQISGQFSAKKKKKITFWNDRVTAV